MPHLACSFVRQLRCVFRCIAMAMQQKPRLADVQNSSAILQHLIRDTTLDFRVVQLRTLFHICPSGVIRKEATRGNRWHNHWLSSSLRRKQKQSKNFWARAIRFLLPTATCGHFQASKAPLTLMITLSPNITFYLTVPNISVC